MYIDERWSDISDKEKILFFDDNWEYLLRILVVIQKNSKHSDLKMGLGSHVFEWVAEFVEAFFDSEST